MFLIRFSGEGTFFCAARACLKTPKEADFAEFSFQARKFSAGVPGHVKGK
jgi:hypothetical protein